jgi:hypothetical protein
MNEHFMSIEKLLTDTTCLTPIMDPFDFPYFEMNLSLDKNIIFKKIEDFLNPKCTIIKCDFEVKKNEQENINHRRLNKNIDLPVFKELLFKTLVEPNDSNSNNDEVEFGVKQEDIFHYHSLKIVRDFDEVDNNENSKFNVDRNPTVKEFREMKPSISAVSVTDNESFYVFERTKKNMVKIDIESLLESLLKSEHFFSDMSNFKPILIDNAETFLVKIKEELDTGKASILFLENSIKFLLIFLWYVD